MIKREELCRQIQTIYPDIGECGIDIDADYDEREERWTVTLRKDNKELKTFLEPGDAELCLTGKKCLNLTIEVNQLKDSIERMPVKTPAPNGKEVSKTAVCEKAPELAEHYRMGDEDLPCDDGRTGDG